MAQTIKHRRGKLESIAGITPINGELIIASGSDLSVHQEGLLFVGVEGNVLTPSNKILTGSADIDVTGGSFDHSVDGIPYYDTDDKKLIILGKGGNLNVEFTTNSLDLKGSGIVSSSSQVSALAGINDSTVTITAGDGLKTGGSFTTNQSGDSEITLDIDVSDFAGTGLNADGSENLNVDSAYLNTSLNSFTASNANTSLNSFTSSLAHGDVDFKGSGIVSGAAQINSLIDDTIAATIVAEIDNDEIPIAKLAADAITIGGTSVTLGTTISNATLLEEVVGGTGIQSGSGDIAGVTAGAGLTGGGSTGTVEVSLDSGSIAGDGLTAKSDGSGLEIAASDFTGDGLEVNSSDIRVKLDGSTIDRSSSGIKLSDENLNTSLNSFTASAGDVVTLDVGISNNNVIQATSGISDDDFLRINGTKVEGLNASEVRTALNVADGAQANVATNLGKTTAAAQITITSSTGNNVVIGEATDTIAGLMSTTHHDKLDGIESNATADQTGAEIATALNSDLGGNFTIGNQSSDTATFSGGVTVDGDLIVNGTTTYVSSSNLNIGDNILELNYAGTAADAGLLVKDAVGTGTSGSLLWDASEDYWIAGALGSEARVIVKSGTNTADTIAKFSADGVITNSIISESGTTLTISDNVIVSGLTADQIVVTNSSKQLVSSTDISSLTLTLDGGEF